MKRSLLLLIIAIIALTSSINANAWTDCNTFGLKGPVKAVQDQFNGDFWEFEEDGDIIYEEGELYYECILRDDYGRITQIGEWRFGYNNKGQVIERSGSGGGMSSTTKYYYNTKGLVTKAIVDECNMYEEDSFTITYTYQKFDKYGNWTKRTAKTGKRSTVQTRTITYY